MQQDRKIRRERRAFRNGTMNSVPARKGFLSGCAGSCVPRAIVNFKKKEKHFRRRVPG